MRKRNESPRTNHDPFPGRCFPENIPIERPRSHVESSIELPYRRVGKPERLIVHRESNDFGIRGIHDHLPGRPKTIGVFGRPTFIKPIDERPVLPNGTPFFEAAPHPEIAVAERKHRLALFEQVGHKLSLDEMPFVGRVNMRRRMEARSMDHKDPHESIARRLWLTLQGPTNAEAIFSKVGSPCTMLVYYSRVGSEAL